MSQLPERQDKYAQGNNGAWIGGFKDMGSKISDLEYDGDKAYRWDPYGSLVARVKVLEDLQECRMLMIFPKWSYLNNHFSILMAMITQVIICPFQILTRREWSSTIRMREQRQGLMDHQSLKIFKYFIKFCMDKF